MQIQHLSFSAHTDAKGILDLVRHVAPRNVVLVHGEKPKMAILKKKISSDLCKSKQNLYFILFYFILGKPVYLAVFKINIELFSA